MRGLCPKCHEESTFELVGFKRLMCRLCGQFFPMALLKRTDDG